MKNNTYKTLSVSILVFAAGFTPAMLTSCAVSEDRGGTTGAVAGGAAGGILANQLGKGKITGSTTGDTIVGAIVGAAVGDTIGRNTTSLKGEKKTEVPNQ